MATTSKNGNDSLDMLIVGGGPAGTAAAFRARELGLTALVIDYDDLMKRIRDYAQGKSIFPDYGGGDRMRFPKGNELLAELRFTPINKDEMCVKWKGLYGRFDIPFKAPVEFLGIETRPDGVHEVLAYDHGVKSETRFVARHVVLAIGRGVPRRFDIPGNTDGIAYRMSDPSMYLNGPVCVIGGGTSAAEAVIAVSRAKSKASEPSSVYWSYRGDKLPRVSKALADDFFECYVEIGNIRYFPRSEPVIVVDGEDGRDYLSIRTDRTCVDNRPPATSHLEFVKENCIACIGEDLPEGLLGGLGIRMQVGGAAAKKRVVTNRLLESERANVYLIGDILSQIYLEADEFGGDPAAFREVRHQGNIKAALRDGVLVANVIKQRLAGNKEFDLRIDDDEEAAPAATAVVAAPARNVSRMTVAPDVAVAPPPPGVDSPKETAAIVALLTRLLPTGVFEAEYPLRRPGIVSIGRVGTDVALENDTMLSERHASVTADERGFFLRDDGSVTGTFLQLKEGRKVEVKANDLLRVGHQFVEFAIDAGRASLIHYDATGREIARHPLPEKTIVLGREAPDIVLDAQDKTLSRRHLAISVEKGTILVKDLKSVNGTFLQVRGAYPLQDGDEFRVGQQRFVFHDAAAVAPKRPESGVVVAPPVAPPAAAPMPATAAAPPPAPKAATPLPTPKAPAPAKVATAVPEAKPAAAGGPSVSFKGAGKFPAKPGETICEIAEENGIDIVAECHAGICGSDPVRILSGMENVLNPVNAQEKETLEDICSLEPGPCRLACMVKVKGAVEVEVLKK